MQSNYFKLNGLDIEYPIYLYINGRKWNFQSEYLKKIRSLTKDAPHQLMDIIIGIGYFNLNILKDVPFLVTDQIRVPGDKRRYYIVDYFIPEYNIVIELTNKFKKSLENKYKYITLSNLGYEVINLDLNGMDDDKITKCLRGLKTSLEFRTKPDNKITPVYFK